MGWGSWSQRSARVAPPANVEVLAHPGKTRYHPRIRNTSIRLQFRQARDKNGDLPGGYRPARCGKPNCAGWLLIAWGSWSHRAARVGPLANVEVAPLKTTLKSYPRMGIQPNIYNSNNPGTKTDSPRVDTAPHAVQTLTPTDNC